ncbi:MAG: FmdB family zinc ribbon protein [Bacillota bacterium]
MPVYEFICPKCKGLHSDLCRLGEDGRGLTCPTCGETGLRKKFSTFAFKAAGNGSSGGKGCSTCSGASCSTCH